MFVNMVEQGYVCPPFISNAILETAKSVFVQDQSNPNVMNVGRVHYLILTSEKSHSFEAGAAIFFMEL